MRAIAKLGLAAALCGGVALGASAPASARVDVGISFGLGLPVYSTIDPCDYYSYYYQPPPWGLPPDYCAYRIYTEPVFWNGEWYHGPIYYGMIGGRREFRLNGGWHRNGWRHGYIPHINWRVRAAHAWRHDWRERHDRWIRVHRVERHQSRQLRHDYRALRHERGEVRHEHRVINQMRRENDRQHHGDRHEDRHGDHGGNRDRHDDRGH